jgi:hypothetical protein
MKLRITLVLALLVISASCSKQKKSIIEGRLDNAPHGEIAYLQELRESGEQIIDSVKVKRSGKFRLSATSDAPGFYQIVFSGGPSLSLILAPNEKLRLTADMNNFYKTKVIDGSPNSIRLNILHDSLRNTIVRLNAIRAEYNRKEDQKLKNNIDTNALAQEFLAIREKYHRYSTGFILDDLRSLANIGALYQEYGQDDYVFNSARDLQFFKLVTDTLTKYYPEVRYVKTLKGNYDAMFTDYQARKLMQSTPFETFDIPELDLPGPSGDNIALSSLKGRIVLLSFWAIDHQESIDNTIALKKIYTIYRKKGFEIYQVAFDKSVPNWKKALAFEEIPWISVIDTSFPGSSTQFLFNVNSLPTNYLFDKEQKEILAKNISPEMLENSLSYLLNGNSHKDISSAESRKAGEGGLNQKP